MPSREPRTPNPQFDADYPDEPEDDAETETAAAPVETGDDEVAGEDRNTR